MDANQTVALAERLVTLEDIKRRLQSANDSFNAKLEEYLSHLSAVAAAEEILRQSQQSTKIAARAANKRLNGRDRHRKGGGKKRDVDSRKAVRVARRSQRRASEVLEEVSLYDNLASAYSALQQAHYRLDDAEGVYAYRKVVLMVGIPLSELPSLAVQVDETTKRINLFYGGSGSDYSPLRPGHGHVVVDEHGIIMYHRRPFEQRLPSHHRPHPLFVRAAQQREGTARLAPAPDPRAPRWREIRRAAVALRSPVVQSAELASAN